LFRYGKEVVGKVSQKPVFPVIAEFPARIPVEVTHLVRTEVVPVPELLIECGKTLFVHPGPFLRSFLTQHPTLCGPEGCPGVRLVGIMSCHLPGRLQHDQLVAAHVVVESLHERIQKRPACGIVYQKLPILASPAVHFTRLGVFNHEDAVNDFLRQGERSSKGPILAPTENGHGSRSHTFVVAGVFWRAKSATEKKPIFVCQLGSGAIDDVHNPAPVWSSRIEYEFTAGCLLMDDGVCPEVDGI
jgi:hypothetical protein